MVVDTPTRVRPSTTTATTQNRVSSMVIMRVSPLVIFETGSARTPCPAPSAAWLTAAATSAAVTEVVSTENSTTS